MIQTSFSQVKIEISHHQLSDNGELTSVKPLVFLVDEPPTGNQGAGDVKKEKKRGKKKKPAGPPVPTSKNFGGHLQISKVKNAQILVLAWRCRCLAASEVGGIFSNKRAYSQVTGYLFPLH